MYIKKIIKTTVVTGLLVVMGMSYNIFAEENTPAWVKTTSPIKKTTNNKPTKVVRNIENTKKSIMDYECLVEPHSLIDLSTREEGIINKIHVKRGDIVKKNQPLVKLESRIEELTVKLAKARAKMNADIAQ